MLYGEQIAYYMNPSNWFDDSEGPSIEERMAGIDDARKASIQAILAERDAIIKRKDAEVEAAIISFDLEQRRRDQRTGELPGGDSGGGNATDNVIDFDAKRLEKLQQRFADEVELLTTQYEERQLLIDQAYLAEEISEAEHRDIMLRMQEEYANKVLAIEKKRNQMAMRGQDQFWSDTISLMSSGSQAAFNIGKTAAISKAVIDGYAAAVAAWNAGMSTGGPLAPAIAAAYTAASVAKTAGLISSLTSTQFGGGGGVSVSGSGNISTGANFDGGAPVVADDVQEAQITNIEINVSGGIHDSNSVRDLIEAINEEVGDGVNLVANIY
jgi:hypothetical protein